MTLDDLRAANVAFPYFSEAYSVYDFLDLINAYNLVVKRVAFENGVDVIDLAAQFDAIPDKRTYFYDTMHPSRMGRELIARRLFAELASVEDWD